MRARGDRAGAVAVALALTGCAKSKAGSAAPPLPPDDIDAIEARVVDNAGELRAAGIAVATPGADGAAADAAAGADAPSADAAPLEEGLADEEEAPPEVLKSSSAGPGEAKRADRRERSRCDRICDLADSTCELADRICDLAAGHPGDPRYARACADATAQCEAATAACDRCE